VNGWQYELNRGIIRNMIADLQANGHIDDQALIA
jgi:uncharacterized membrane protein YebE (DUF533 family)